MFVEETWKHSAMYLVRFKILNNVMCNLVQSFKCEKQMNSAFKRIITRKLSD